jgi:predicted aconitase with swiveling domain
MTSQSDGSTRVLFAGEATGSVLRFDAPISFWGGIDPTDSTVTLAGHPQLGESIAKKILVIPELVGSSSSSAIMLELLHRKQAPAGLILGNTDAILPIGVLVASEMDWPTIPVIRVNNPPYQTGEQVSISSDGVVSKIAP